MDLSALNKLMLEYQLSALPEIIAGKHVYINVTSEIADDPVVSEVCGMTGGSGQSSGYFLGTPIHVVKGTSTIVCDTGQSNG